MSDSPSLPWWTTRSPIATASLAPANMVAYSFFLKWRVVLASGEAAQSSLMQAAPPSVWTTSGRDSVGRTVAARPSSVPTASELGDVGGAQEAWLAGAEVVGPVLAEGQVGGPVAAPAAVAAGLGPPPPPGRLAGHEALLGHDGAHHLLGDDGRRPLVALLEVPPADGLALVSISRREHRTFRGFRTGVHAVSVSPVSRARIATSFRRAASSR